MTWRGVGVFVGSLAAATVFAGAPAPASDSVSAAAPRSVADPVGDARQLVLVTAGDWDSATGVMRRFERRNVMAAWVEVGRPVTVNLGRSGLGWGRGLHGDTLGDGPVKEEGDGRAPAGAFRLTEAFGYAERTSSAIKALKLPYQQATADLQCVDDVASSRYNQIVERSRVRHPDWTSHEDMLRGDGQYAVGLVVAQNAEPAIPGRGSCVFVHIWRGPGLPTAGCTAATATDIRQLVLWLDARHSPVLVQLPDAEFVRWRAAWRLP